MKVVSFIEDRRVVERLLWHLDLLAELSRRSALRRFRLPTLLRRFARRGKEDVVYHPFWALEEPSETDPCCLRTDVPQPQKAQKASAPKNRQESFNRRNELRLQLIERAR